MTYRLVPRAQKGDIPIHPVHRRDMKRWIASRPTSARAWIESIGFRVEPGQHCLLPSAHGKIASVVVGVGGNGPWDWAPLAALLPRHRYHIDAKLSDAEAEDAALGWALGTYEFARYRKPRLPTATLAWPAGANRKRVARLAHGTFLARDLINTPASDMGPAELAKAAIDLAKAHGAKHRVIEGAKLLDEGYPAIHAVGRASSRAPRLVDLRWGNAKDPRVTLVGKGVCFDSGGLDLKGASNMKLMKKDMGGAALVLGLAHAIMDAKLRVRLRVLVPAVENSVSGDAYRPLDVLATRKGLTVEVGNTDAEGRIILSDALAEADSESPDLLVDVATLTGAARVALGAQVPAVFSTDEAASSELLAASGRVRDPLWRLPLVDAYRRQIDSPVADLNNVSEGGYGGAITAALFLREFVSRKTPWIHVDTMGWNLESQPGRPSGGEALGLRALYAMLEARYG